MKRHLTLLTTSLLALSGIHSSLHAQSVQQVTVLEYNGKEQKTPLAGVNVAVTNAMASLSDANGQISLRFRTLHPGDQVNVKRIEKNGYEVFNSQALEQWFVSTSRPFQLIMCQSEQFRALRDQYSRVASESYARQYKAEQAKLKAERKKTKMQEEVYQQRLLDLENQYQQQLEDLENYVDQFARIDLSELNSHQQELIELVKAGKIEEAIKKYESADYQAQYEQQCRDIIKIERAQAQLALAEAKQRSQREGLYHAIQRQIATYRLAGGRENFEKVTNLMKSVADADTTYLNPVWDYARLSLQNNQLDESERYFGIFLRGCQGDSLQQANALYMLAQSYMQKSYYEKAEEYYGQTLQIIQQLHDQDPERYAQQSLKVKQNLSTYYYLTNQADKATVMQASAIEECKMRYQTEPEEYQERLADLYGSDCLIQYAAGKTDEAILSGKKGLELAQSIEKTDETIALIIQSISNLGMVYYLTERWQELADVQQENVNLCEELYAKNPVLYIKYINSAYNNLAEARLQSGEIDKAEHAFLKAIGFTQQMVQEAPTLHHSDEFALYEIGARLYLQRGDTVKTKHYREAAIKAYKKMAPADQERNQNEYQRLQELITNN